jgi:hypothetical protein
LFCLYSRVGLIKTGFILWRWKIAMKPSKCTALEQGRKSAAPAS